MDGCQRKSMRQQGRDLRHDALIRADEQCFVISSVDERHCGLFHSSAVFAESLNRTRSQKSLKVQLARRKDLLRRVLMSWTNAMETNGHRRIPVAVCETQPLLIEGIRSTL